MKAQDHWSSFVFLWLFLILSICVPVKGEVIGDWNILSAPISASVQSGNPTALITWTNVYNESISLNETFSGMSVIDDGLANLPYGTTITMTFAPGTALNKPGADLVLFEAFDAGSYRLSSSYDNFGSSIGIPQSQFISTGLQQAYYYGVDWGPFLSPIRGAPIDLSQLGVPLGQYVNELRLTVTTSGSDPLGIGSMSIPEPMTLALLAFGGMAILRKQK